MVPRLRFDIGWRDLARTAGQCLWPPAEVSLPLSSDAHYESQATLSVRSAFDLLLSALDLPAGSEVLLSEVTVPHMLSIIREHGLVPLSVPVDPRTLHVDAGEVESRLTNRTKLIVIAHLFGARAPLEPISLLAQQRGILLVEDAAQAVVGGNLHRDPAADVSLFSFGPIKTATALGGGVALVKDDALRTHMQQIAATWPQQSHFDFLQRVIKIALLKFLSYPAMLGLLVATIRLFGGDADKFVGGSAKGFSGERLFAQLRRKPCGALRYLLAYRLANFRLDRITERSESGRRLADKLGALPRLLVAGCENPSHSFWVFPIVCDQPSAVVAELREAGFDASQISGLTVVDDNLDLDAEHWFRRTVFIPHSCAITNRQQEDILGVVSRAA